MTLHLAFKNQYCPKSSSSNINLENCKIRPKKPETNKKNGKIGEEIMRHF